MALTVAPRRSSPTSVALHPVPPRPRVGVVPEADLSEYQRAVEETGLQQFLWELDAAAAMYATDGEHWLFGEVCFVVSRRNGKTTLVLPRIVDGLRRGEKILHTAHNRDLPRETFVLLASIAPRLFSKSEIKGIRWANGNEKIELTNGASYRIASDRQGAGRGHGADTVIVDELREQDSFDLVAALSPTLADSHNPQTIYLSNAGHEKSVILNDLRDRAGKDPNLCYLEWSADPDRDASDRDGWREANPALPHLPWMWRYLETQFVSRPSSIFETEHLCRWVSSMSPAFLTDIAWRHCQVENDSQPFRPYLGVALDPAGKRASAALAWKADDGTVYYRPLLEVTDPAAIDVDDFGEQVRAAALRYRVRGSAYSAVSDTALARYLTKPTTVDGRLFANASANFATLVENRRLRWSEDGVSDDLRYTIRKEHAEGAWSAVRSEDSRPITAVLAAVRAVWLASAPKPPVPRIG